MQSVINWFRICSENEFRNVSGIQRETQMNFCRSPFGNFIGVLRNWTIKKDINVTVRQVRAE